ncbi:MAG TPA: S9 family peptidase [Steroidobacteraceae bacterium]
MLMLVGVISPSRGLAAPLELYGQLPILEDLALSPDGTRIAFVKTTGDERTVIMMVLATDKNLGAVRVGNSKLRRIEWVDNNRLIIVTSTSSTPAGFKRTGYEWYQLHVYDVNKHSDTELPDLDQFPMIHGQRRYNLLNTIYGNVLVRQLQGHTVLFVSSYNMRDKAVPVVLRMDLDTGDESVLQEGSEATGGWLIDDTGQMAAETFYFELEQRWELMALRDGSLQRVASGKEAIDAPRLLGFGPTADTVLMQFVENGDYVWKLLSMKDGTFGPPMTERRQLTAPIEDRYTHRLIGGVRIEDESHYEFFDPVLQARWDNIVRAFQGERLRLMSYSADFTKIVVRVDGAKHGYGYELVDTEARKVAALGEVYEGMGKPLEVRSISYPAADGLVIPALLTLPANRPPTNLPLIVMPHQGPDGRETADFDWWSQALASQGYAVLQPNYRGSDVNYQFLSAGFGQWGRKMQSDLSDGVRYLAKEGIADPSRVCIVGTTYGGYAALAGVSLEPGVYRCAVAVAGQSDLKQYLQWLDIKQARDITLRYLDRYIGVNGPGDPRLDEISPIKHVDAITAPVLLIHGKNDTVISFEQSQNMFDALRRAKKEVELVTLKQEDHWLSRSETRLQTLQATVKFVRAHNPPD